MTRKESNQTPAAEGNSVDLNELKDRYRLLMDLSDAGLMIVQDGVIKECNHSMARLSGVAIDSLLDRSLDEYFPADKNPALRTILGDRTNKAVASEWQQGTLIGANGLLQKVAAESRIRRL